VQQTDGLDPATRDLFFEIAAILDLYDVLVDYGLLQL
jgi:hypothetical protein